MNRKLLGPGMVVCAMVTGATALAQNSPGYRAESARAAAHARVAAGNALQMTPLVKAESCKAGGATCYYKKGSGVANCYGPGGMNRSFAAFPCEEGGGTWTQDSNGKRVCKGVQNPCD